MNPAQMETLLDRLERVADLEAREAARALVGQLLQTQGEALARLVERTRAAPGGAELLAAWAADPLVAGLLLLHGLHPEGLSVRLSKAMTSLTPVAEFIGIQMCLVGIGQTCTVELHAGAEVPLSALDELRGQVESAIVGAAPEVESVRFEVSRRVGLPMLGRAVP